MPFTILVCAKAINDPHLRYSTDSSDAQSRLFVQHHRVHLKVSSEDLFWHEDSVEWFENQFITVKVLDNDTQSLVFSSLGDGPVMLRRGDSVSYFKLSGFAVLLFDEHEATRGPLMLQQCGLDTSPMKFNRGLRECRMSCLPTQTSYDVSLGFCPTDSPIAVTIQPPVGTKVEPEALEFSLDNWNVTQAVRVQIEDFFPATPFVRLHSATRFGNFECL